MRWSDTSMGSVSRDFLQSWSLGMATPRMYLMRSCGSRKNLSKLSDGRNDGNWHALEWRTKWKMMWAPVLTAPMPSVMATVTPAVRQTEMTPLTEMARPLRLRKTRTYIPQTAPFARPASARAAMTTRLQVTTTVTQQRRVAMTAAVGMRSRAKWILAVVNTVTIAATVKKAPTATTVAPLRKRARGIPAACKGLARAHVACVARVEHPGTAVGAAVAVDLARVGAMEVIGAAGAASAVEVAVGRMHLPPSGVTPGLISRGVAGGGMHSSFIVPCPSSPLACLRRANEINAVCGLNVGQLTAGQFTHRLPVSQPFKLVLPNKSNRNLATIIVIT
eukprot:Opistho-2@89609